MTPVIAPGGVAALRACANADQIPNQGNTLFIIIINYLTNRFGRIHSVVVMVADPGDLLRGVVSKPAALAAAAYY